MKKEAKSLVGKSAKIACVTCIAAGAVALMTTGAALKALTEGAKYLKNTVQRIIDEHVAAEPVMDAEAADEDFEEEAVAEEPAVTEENDLV